jgi:hypothetical protein
VAEKQVRGSRNEAKILKIFSLYLFLDPVFPVGFVPLTVAGQRWNYTTFPYRFGLF